jgi:hypothetical protein
MLTRAAPAKVDPSWDARISKLRTRQREARRIDPVTTTVNPSLSHFIEESSYSVK